MNIFKIFSMWPFKKHIVESRIDKETFSKTCTEPIIIPEPIIEVKDDDIKIKDHNNFSILTKIDDTIFRIMSKHSHEIVRLDCQCHNNEFSKLSNITNNFNCSLHYVSKIKKSSIVKRLFITDNGRFFYQNIYYDNTVKYYFVTKQDVQRDMNIWEKPVKDPAIIRHCTDYDAGHFIYIPGTYDNVESAIRGSYTYNWEIHVNSYEVIDKERYDKLIEVL